MCYVSWVHVGCIHGMHSLGCGHSIDSVGDRQMRRGRVSIDGVGDRCVVGTCHRWCEWRTHMVCTWWAWYR